MTLSTGSSADDVDGASLRLASPAALVTVEASLNGAPLERGQVILGDGTAGIDDVPFTILCADPRLQVAPSAPPVPNSGASLYLWVTEAGDTPASPAALDAALRDELRALGYLE